MADGDPSGPGSCQVCGRFRALTQRWPVTLPARYLDLCADCQRLSDEEITAMVDPGWRRDRAVI
jgi:hypothetical protein